MARSRIYKLPLAIICDALKIAYSTQGRRQYKDVFLMLRRFAKRWTLQIRCSERFGARRRTTVFADFEILLGQEGGIDITQPASEFWRQRRVFLTGHTGFKGAWMNLWLQVLGAKVTGYALAPHTEPNLFAMVAGNARRTSPIFAMRANSAMP